MVETRKLAKKVETLKEELLSKTRERAFFKILHEANIVSLSAFLISGDGGAQKYGMYKIWRFEQI